MVRPTKRQRWYKALSQMKTKLSPEIVSKLKEAFAIGATVNQACYYAEIAESTYYRWVKENPRLSEEFNTMRAKLPLAAKKNIAIAITNKEDIGLSKWLVERTEPDSYGEKITIDLNDGTNPEDREAIIAFHARIKENRIKKSLEKAKEEGEIK